MYEFARPPFGSTACPSFQPGLRRLGRRGGTEVCQCSSLRPEQWGGRDLGSGRPPCEGAGVDRAGRDPDARLGAGRSRPDRAGRDGPAESRPPVHVALPAVFLQAGDLGRVAHGGRTEDGDAASSAHQPAVVLVDENDEGRRHDPPPGSLGRRALVAGGLERGSRVGATVLRFGVTPHAPARHARSDLTRPRGRTRRRGPGWFPWHPGREGLGRRCTPPQADSVS